MGEGEPGAGAAPVKVKEEAADLTLPEPAFPQPEKPSTALTGDEVELNVVYEAEVGQAESKPEEKDQEDPAAESQGVELERGESGAALERAILFESRAVLNDVVRVSTQLVRFMERSLAETVNQAEIEEFIEQFGEEVSRLAELIESLARTQTANHPLFTQAQEHYQVHVHQLFLRIRHAHAVISGGEPVPELERDEVAQSLQVIFGQDHPSQCPESVQRHLRFELHSLQTAQATVEGQAQGLRLVMAT